MLIYEMAVEIKYIDARKCIRNTSIFQLTHQNVETLFEMRFSSFLYNICIDYNMPIFILVLVSSQTPLSARGFRRLGNFKVTIYTKPNVFVHIYIYIFENYISIHTPNVMAFVTKFDKLFHDRHNVSIVCIHGSKYHLSAPWQVSSSNTICC